MDCQLVCNNFEQSESDSIISFSADKQDSGSRWIEISFTRFEETRRYWI